MFEKASVPKSSLFAVRQAWIGLVGVPKCFGVKVVESSPHSVTDILEFTSLLLLSLRWMLPRRV